MATGVNLEAKRVTIDLLMPVAMVLMLAAAVQAAVGFGAGLFAIPLLVWLAVPLPMAVGLVLMLVVVQVGFNCWPHRGQLPWRLVIPMFLLRGVGLPVGIALMYLISALDPSRTKQVIGVALLVVLGLQSWWKVQPRQHVHWSWTVLAGTLSGLMAGMVGMGGPPLVLWVLAHDWPASRQRVFLWMTFLLQVPVQSALMALTFGKPLVIALLFGIALTPAGLLGAWIGGRVGARMSRARLRAAMILVLLGLGVYSIVSPMF